MKEITGYLIDRTTGAGIASKAVAFKKLDGSAVSTAETYYQDVSATTDSDGKFYGKFELSPGPVKVEVTVSGSEKKVRKHDEKAQMGIQWSSDISKLGLAVGDQFLKTLNRMAPTVGSGHNIQIATGGAIVGGVPFTIENGQMTIAGTSNPGGSGIDPRLDLVTLRQYKESASGQNAGKQAVIITNGTTSNIVPAVPTGSDFTDLPLAVFSTAMGAATKTLYQDRRNFGPTQNEIEDGGQLGDYADVATDTVVTSSYVALATPTITALTPDAIYDGYIHIDGRWFIADSASDQGIYLQINKSEIIGPTLTNYKIAFNSAAQGSVGDGNFSYHHFLHNITGVTSYSVPIEFKRYGTSNPTISQARCWLVLHRRR